MILSDTVVKKQTKNQAGFLYEDLGNYIHKEVHPEQ